MALTIPAADLEILGGADVGHRQVFAIQFQQSQVTLLVGTDQFRFQFATVLQAHNDFVRLGHHMIVGQYIAIRGDDEPGTQRTGLPFLRH